MICIMDRLWEDILRVTRSPRMYGEDNSCIYSRASREDNLCKFSTLNVEDNLYI